MRIPRVIVHLAHVVHDSYDVQIQLDLAEWQDPVLATKLLRELIKTSDLCLNMLGGKIGNYAHDKAIVITTALQDAFIPLLTREEIWWENDKLYVREETVRSMTCLREMAKEP